MLARILTGIIGIPLVIALIFFPGGALFALAIAVVASIGLSEFYRGVKTAGMRPWGILGVLASLLMIHGSFDGNFHQVPVFYAGSLTLLLILCLVFELFREERKPLFNTAATVLGVVYVGWLISHIVLIRSIPGKVALWGLDAEKGAWLTLFVFLGTWACDTGAYFSGKFLGKHKLAPSLSPGKTIEGSVGGFVLAIVVCGLFGRAITLPIAHALVMGALIGIVAQVGDLVESSIKREIGVKDFGSLLPGHGGALDRFDSLLFTAPVVFYYVMAILPRWVG